MSIQKKLMILWRIIGPKQPDQMYVGQRSEEYKKYWEAVARDINAEIEAIDNDIWRISKDGKSTKIYQYQLSLDNPVTLELAARKGAVHSLLRSEGIAVPKHILISPDETEKAIQFLATLPDGIVVKPNAGYGGKGISTHITHKRQLKRALVTASLYDTRTLLEEQVYGECFRLLVFQGKMIAAARRTGIRVVGDGQSNLIELAPAIDFKSPNEDTAFCLKKNKLTPLTVLERDTTCLIACAGETWRRGTELRTIYDEDVTHEVCPTVADQACAAARLVGSQFAGVDVITSDISKPLAETAGIINEVNTTPALHHHHNPATQRYPEPARHIIEALLTDERTKRSTNTSELALLQTST